jgi:hypothetical protein
MTPNQLKAISRNPKAMMDFQLMRKIPTEKKCPSTPLRQLIESIPTMFWEHINGVTLSPSLGFNTSLQFNNLHQLAAWLGHNKTNMFNTRMPYQSWKIGSFNKKLFIDDLLLSSSNYLDTSTIRKNTPKSLWK